MNLLIIRHGEAEPSTGSDSERNLTDYGHQQAKLAGLYLAQSALKFDHIWVSPYRRAQQTAEELMSSMTPMPRREIAELVPETKPVVLLELIEQAQAENLIIVSHQPLVSALAGLMVNGNIRSGPSMSTASMVLLEVNQWLPGCSQLQWLRHAPTFQAGY